MDEGPAGGDDSEVAALKKKKKWMADDVISHSRESRRRNWIKGREKDKLIKKEAMAMEDFVVQTLGAEAWPGN